MATHHQASPPGSIHPHYRPPPAHLQPNGHVQAPSQQQPQQQPPNQPPAQHTQPPQQRPPPPPNSIEALQALNEATWIQCGRCAEAMGQYDDAVASYQRALNFNRTSMEALNLIATVLRFQDKFDQAAEFINQILQLHPNDGENWSALGHCYLMMDELQKAYQAYQSALYNLRDPKEPKLWYGIGILYDRYGSLDHAEEAFSQVMRMSPDFDKANEIYFRLGIIYKQQGKYTESLECFRYIVTNPPRPLVETDILFQIGHVYEQQKDYENAKSSYKQVLDRDPSHAKVLQQLGWLHHQQSPDYNSQEQAIDYLEKSVNADQSDPQSWYLLGRCYMSQAKFPKAYEAYQQAVYRDGRNPTFWCSIGVLYYQINQYRDALDAYSRAIRLNPNISEVWYDLGTLYESCNNQTNDALDAYQRAAELDPSNQHIKARLQLLRNGQPTGLPNQNGAPMPQDIHPQAYQAPGVSGPPQPQWPSQQQNQQPPQGPPPPSLTAGRDWGRPADPPASAARPPHHAGNSYDQRDPARPYQPPRAPSPRSERMRHAPDPSRHRHMSPSPRTRNSIPNSYHGPQSMPQGPPPHSMSQPPPHHHQSSQPPPPHQGQQPGPNRISNPNFGAHSIPPPPPSQGGGPSQQATLPPYGRPGSPPPPVRPVMDGQPSSPHSYAPRQGPQNPYQQHHPDPNHPSSIASGAPAPASALAAAEAAAAREREAAGTPGSGSKRPREWEEREQSDGSNKKQASDENRARLEDPQPLRRGSPPPSLPSIDRVDPARMPQSGHSSGPTSGVSSPEAAKRAEDIRQANDNYRPSEVAHHPQPLNTVMHKEEPNSAQSALSQREALPSMQNATNEKRSDSPLSAEEQRRKDELEKREREQRDREMQMRIDEPAARKVDIDENYDDDSAEESKSAVKDSQTATGGSGSASATGSGQVSPKTSVPPTSAPPVSNGADAVNSEEHRPKIEATA